jgi:hypothetical protein
MSQPHRPVPNIILPLRDRQQSPVAAAAAAEAAAALQQLNGISFSAAASPPSRTAPIRCMSDNNLSQQASSLHPQQHRYNSASNSAQSPRFRRTITTTSPHAGSVPEVSPPPSKTRPPSPSSAAAAKLMRSGGCFILGGLICCVVLACVVFSNGRFTPIRRGFHTLSFWSQTALTSDHGAFISSQKLEIGKPLDLAKEEAAGHDRSDAVKPSHVASSRRCLQNASQDKPVALAHHAVKQEHGSVTSHPSSSLYWRFSSSTSTPDDELRATPATEPLPPAVKPEDFPQPTARESIDQHVGNETLDASYAEKYPCLVPRRTDHIAMLYQLAYDFDKVWNQFQLPYSIEDGTLLGAMRHEGIIPSVT